MSEQETEHPMHTESSPLPEPPSAPPPPPAPTPLKSPAELRREQSLQDFKNRLVEHREWEVKLKTLRPRNPRSRKDL